MHHLIQIKANERATKSLTKVTIDRKVARVHRNRRIRVKRKSGRTSVDHASRRQKNTIFLRRR